MTVQDKKIDRQNLSQEECARYSRHFSLPELGVTGQQKIKSSRILCIGAGGLGSTVLLYLASAGVGNIGIIEHDEVEISNLQRQIIYDTEDLGKLKVLLAKERLNSLNPNVNINTFEYPLNKENAKSIFTEYDIVIDCSDNYRTRYIANEFCFYLDKPLIAASLYQFEGQCSVYNYNQGPCYQCLYPEAPPKKLRSNCSEAGVLGAVAGLLGTIQAIEAIKIILNKSSTLSGRLLTVDALAMVFNEYEVAKDKSCKLCSGKNKFKSGIFLNIRDSFEESPLVHNGKEISVRALKKELDEGADIELIDVREPYEYEICHLRSILIPLSHLENNLSMLDKNKNYVIYCRVGQRSMIAVELMMSHGFKKVRNLNGGIRDWAKYIDPTMQTY